MGSTILAIALFSISGVFAYGFSCFFYLKLAGVPMLKTLHLITKSLALAVPFLIPLIGVKIFEFPALATVLMASLLFIAYGICILLTDPLLQSLISGLKIRSLNKR